MNDEKQYRIKVCEGGVRRETAYFGALDDDAAREQLGAEAREWDGGHTLTLVGPDGAEVEQVGGAL